MAGAEGTVKLCPAEEKRGSLGLDISALRKDIPSFQDSFLLLEQCPGAHDQDLDGDTLYLLCNSNGRS